MLSGLLFAIDDADDRPGRLTATLPFAGVTLIEYQARLLIAAGAAQVIIVVAKGASLNAAFEGAEEGYPRVLAGQLYDLLVPGSLLLFVLFCLFRLFCCLAAVHGAARISTLGR